MLVDKKELKELISKEPKHNDYLLLFQQKITDLELMVIYHMAVPLPAIDMKGISDDKFNKWYEKMMGKPMIKLYSQMDSQQIQDILTLSLLLYKQYGVLYTGYNGVEIMKEATGENIRELYLGYDRIPEEFCNLYTVMAVIGERLKLKNWSVV